MRYMVVGYPFLLFTLDPDNTTLFTRIHHTFHQQMYYLMSSVKLVSIMTEAEIRCLLGYLQVTLVSFIE